MLFAIGRSRVNSARDIYRGHYIYCQTPLAIFYQGNNITLQDITLNYIPLQYFTKVMFRCIIHYIHVTLHLLLLFLETFIFYYLSNKIHWKIIVNTQDKYQTKCDHYIYSWIHASWIHASCIHASRIHASRIHASRIHASWTHASWIQQSESWIHASWTHRCGSHGLSAQRA